MARHRPLRTPKPGLIAEQGESMGFGPQLWLWDTFPGSGLVAPFGLAEHPAPQGFLWQRVTLPSRYRDLVPFVVAGLYLIGNASASFLQKGKLSTRLLFDLVVGFLALPLHSWLFFGKPDGVSITSIVLPGGTGISLFDTNHLSFLIAKAVVALLLVALDLYLISEIFGLGWFTVKGPPFKK